MAEKDQIFKSSLKWKGIFPFADFYKFCNRWLTEETGLGAFSEDKYSEKLVAGNAKEIDIEWTASKKMTDYFKMEMKVKFEIKGLVEVEIQKNGVKIKSNQGEIKMDVKGFLIKDYDSKFESTAFRKFLRGIYEKWVIKPRIDQFEDKVADDSNEFLGQAKAYLDLEGK